jgi:glycosyltransferase involved in cell wall biosynthesis
MAVVSFMEISVIVSTYSPERFNDLLDLLDGLESQSSKDFEIIIVVDENLDYFQIVKEKIGCAKHVKLVYNETNKGLAFSRNLGVKHAEGRIVAFIDDDAIPYPNWVEETLNAFKDENTGGLAGEIIPAWKNESQTWFPRELWWIVSCSYTDRPKICQNVRNGFGTNMSFEKKTLQDAGFFTTALGKQGKKWMVGEETELCIRIGEKTKKRVILNPNVKVKHKVDCYRLQMKNIIKRAYWEGYSKAVLSSMYRKEALSAESTYLKRLLFSFYPQSLKNVIRQPLDTIKQIETVTIVILAVASGYFFCKASQILKGNNQREQK